MRLAKAAAVATATTTTSTHALINSQHETIDSKELKENNNKKLAMLQIVFGAFSNSRSS